jgi:hypothetical protein
MGGYGGGMMGGYNPYQMQSPYGPQMGGYGGGFGGGMGGYGRGGRGMDRGGYGRGRGMDREVGNQGMGDYGMMSDMRYRGGDDMLQQRDQMYGQQQVIRQPQMMSDMQYRGGNQDSDMYSPHALPSNYRPNAQAPSYDGANMADMLQQLA